MYHASTWQRMAAAITICGKNHSLTENSGARNLCDDAGVGKTALIHQFVHQKFSSTSYRATIGADFMDKSCVVEVGTSHLQYRRVLVMSGDLHFLAVTRLGDGRDSDICMRKPDCTAAHKAPACAPCRPSPMHVHSRPRSR
jgi:Ras family